MKNLKSFQTLQTINNQSISAVKGGATMDEINAIYKDGLLKDDQYATLMKDIETGIIDPKSLTGEWWGAGSL